MKMANKKTLLNALMAGTILATVSAGHAFSSDDGLATASPDAYRLQLEEQAAKQRRIRKMRIERDLAAAEAENLHAQKNLQEARKSLITQTTFTKEEAEKYAKQMAEEIVSEKIDEIRKQEAAKQAAKAPAASAPVSPFDNQRMPRIARISGVGAEKTAVLLIPFRGEQIVREGDILDDGSKIQEISADGVKVRSQKGKVSNLIFGTQAPIATIGVGR